MYIRATGNISPQKTFGHAPFLTEPLAYSGSRLICAEPDYKEIIDVKLIRRMSRIIRMGVAAAMECLQEAGVQKPDAIVTGTAYGCLEDTGLFLTKMIEFKEELLTPTAFIQSTHNTIGAQIGLMLQCNNYNNTFVHRGFSFESALLDAMMLLNDQEVTNVLVGAVDEITDISYAILNRMGFWKQEPVSNLELFRSKAATTRGTIAGEGSAFFLLTNESSGADYAKLDAFTTIYKPEGRKEIEDHLLSFLSMHQFTLNDIDLVITGRNGNAGSDETVDGLQQNIFSKNHSVNFKHLCGEYPTSTAFALWVAANILKSGAVPPVLEYTGPKEKKIRRILIHNHYLNIHHSFLLISAC
jgi:3-oxoacyl-[acyl-carrier-protein] synthase II